MYIRWADLRTDLRLAARSIDNAAHMGGLAGGFGVAYLAGDTRPGRLADETSGAPPAGFAS